MLNSTKSQEGNLYLHAFNLLPQFGPARLLKLHNFFHSYQHAFEAPENRLLQAGIEPEIVTLFLEHKHRVNLAAEAESLLTLGIHLLSFADAAYPPILLEIPKFPPLLYFRGRMDRPDDLCFSVVGTRNITPYGRNIIPDLISPLVESGVVIVSGLAYGVDSEAHKIATKLGKRTIAVLGGGLDDRSLYPKHHQFLAQDILNNNGALLSEYPPGTPNFKQHFVARNRIISGLSLGTLVVECDLASGSLITARHALEQNRQVFAVPGPIYSEMSKGPNNLIKMGAKAVTEASDIMEDLNLKNLPDEQSSQNLLSDNLEENKILQIVSKAPLHVNEIIKLSGLEAGTATAALTFLEMKGRIRNLGGQQYVKSR